MQTKWDSVTDWNAAYDNRAAVPEHEEYFYDWGRSAAEFREAHPPEDIAYGDAVRERIDLYRPEGEAKGLVVFIHGGWWSFFGREYFSHLAAGALAQGWAMAMPSYTLCPEIAVGGIVAQMTRAVAAASEAAPAGPLVIAGHSAGGHLAAMMGIEEGGLGATEAARLERIVAISGIADLRPLMRVAMNETLKIDEAEARAASPLMLTPRRGFDFIAVAGGDELAEFRRQNALLAHHFGAHVGSRRVEAVGCNHFDVIDPLANPDSRLTRAITLQDGQTGPNDQSG